MTGRIATRLRRFVLGDRPYVAALIVIVVLSTLMLAEPVSRHLEGRERIALLEQQRDALEVEIDRLEARAADLDDPEQIELIAREQLGLVREGEVPYVVVLPEDDRPEIVPSEETAPPERAWYRRALDRIAGLAR